MNKLFWNLWDDWERFDLADSNARPGVYQGRNALYLEKAGFPILLRDELPFDYYRLSAEVAIPEQVGFIGLIFGARNSQNYELVYLAPEEIQYDPVMNDSMTWQIYNGPLYQKPLQNTTGEWKNLSLEVQPNRVAVYLGEDPSPQLVITKLQHGISIRKIGFWGYLPCYIRNFSVEELKPLPTCRSYPDMKKLIEETFVTEWKVSKPYVPNKKMEGNQHWTKAMVEENGTLNLNRLLPAEQGISVQAESTFTIPYEKETELTFGYSDRLRLWINEVEVYQGDWRWAPPESDGRIRSNYASLPIRWKAGLNTIRAEITNLESFGWGLTIKTGLNNMSFVTDGH